ncbi:MAG: rhomboid family intramembrane serine protease [Syntrophales bacterium]|jgi:membrane associated rhomboid family serine protease|nr:rhomboid family intramembrane serine protease [Syntrophales bacterium]MCK9528247.1 rhomboid family intramembrane serine protease [Syntrophales bacterium]MDX9922378.1 rhomboid family intramembrane serine protease [Syntrophales bacterium]
MIPIRDTLRSKNFPLVTTGIIILNIVVFLVQIGQGPKLDDFISAHGLVPVGFSLSPAFGGQALTLITYMFLHGGFWHLAGNMWFLYIFGDNVEDTLGSGLYLLFFLACGVFSGLVHLVLNMSSPVPTIGASGAVAGVMGAYFIRYPRSRILTLIPIFFIPFFVEVPAALFLGVWFLFQFLSAALLHSAASGIAWWAHVGGFIAGIVVFRGLMAVPARGCAGPLRRVTRKRQSPRIHMARDYGSEGNNFYGTITITSEESLRGTRKIISVPRGVGKRLFSVVIPPGIRHGQVVRLAGLGGKTGSGESGDGYLTIKVDDAP